jgi:hypothetical protein
MPSPFTFADPQPDFFNGGPDGICSAAEVKPAAPDNIRPVITIPPMTMGRKRRKKMAARYVGK